MTTWGFLYYVHLVALCSTHLSEMPASMTFSVLHSSKFAGHVAELCRPPTVKPQRLRGSDIVVALLAALIMLFDSG